MKEPKRGGVCYSLQGRDKGRWYVILKVEPGYVFVTDGKAGGAKSPKKKNLKHVYLTPREVELPERDDKVRDNEIHRALKNILETKTEDGECQKTT
ncbi:MAG: KOW domain-containing RNA-binding protein [Clostridia bacterium]|nr:KOW domain-containing RNA-binding protein [Clostridia bacterium]